MIMFCCFRQILHLTLPKIFWVHFNILHCHISRLLLECNSLKMHFGWNIYLTILCIHLHELSLKAVDHLLNPATLHQLLCVFACSVAHAPQPYVSFRLSLRLGHRLKHTCIALSYISGEYILASHLNWTKNELPPRIFGFLTAAKNMTSSCDCFVFKRWQHRSGAVSRRGSLMRHALRKILWSV